VTGDGGGFDTEKISIQKVNIFKTITFNA